MSGISVPPKDLVLRSGVAHPVLTYGLIPWVFIGMDLLSISFQGVGGIIAAIYTSEPESVMVKVGGNMMIAGVCSLVAKMLLRGLLTVVYWRGYQESKRSTAENRMRSARSVRMFVWAVSVADVFLPLRSIYRIAEMAGGWGESGSAG